MKKEFNIYQNIGFIFQTIITVFVMFSLILSALVEEMSGLTRLLVTLMLIGFAINNHFTFKRKWFTLAYLGMAVVGLVSFL